MKLLGKCFVFILLAIIFYALPSIRPVYATPDIVVQTHIWWDTRYGIDSAVWPIATRHDTPGQYIWAAWDKRDYGGNGTLSPDTLQPDGWRRAANASKDYYPMIGLYDPDDPEVLRWQIKLAKAAGIKAFAVSLYFWGPPAGDRLAEIMRKFLEVAKQENFYLSWETWTADPGFLDRFSQWKDIVNHPNFYRIDGKPVIWIAPSDSYPIYGHNLAEMDQILTQIETVVGTPIYWAINNGNPNIDTYLSTKSVIPMTPANIFTTPENWSSMLTTNVNRAHSLNKKSGSHIYPGFDESVLNRSGTRYHPRNGGDTLKTALQKSAQKGADVIFLESWNDFGESTAIEPGLKEDFYTGAYQRDYYKDLRIISEFTGSNFTPPPLLQESSLDPVVRERLKHHVTFQAKAALSNTAQASNGVNFSLQTLYSGTWYQLAGRNVKFSDGVVSFSQDISELYGKNVTLLLATDAGGDSGSDQAHWLDAGIYLDGVKTIDLISKAPTANWHSSQGQITWGTGGPGGTAMYGINSVLSDGKTYAKTLYVHPDYSANGFTHGGYTLDLTTPPFTSNPDINRDGKINLLDLAKIVNKRTAPSVPANSSTPENLDGDSDVDSTDLQLFLSQYTHL